MKTLKSHFHSGFLALPFCAALALAPSLQAESSQHLVQEIELLPTLNAPAEAGGTATLKAHDGDDVDDEADKGGLTVNPTGLLSGTYEVSATLKSSGSSVLLGSVVVVGGTSASTVKFGTVENPYPVDFNPYDVAGVAVTTPGVDLLDPLDDVIYLTGDFTDPATSFKSRLHVNKPLTFIVSGTAVVPPAENEQEDEDAVTDDGSPKGRLVINARFKNEEVRALIKFKAHNLPPNTSYVLVINNVPTANTYTTDNKGKILLKQTPGKGKANGNGKHLLPGLNPFEIQSISLADPITNEVVIEGSL